LIRIIGYVAATLFWLYKWMQEIDAHGWHAIRHTVVAFLATIH
jgi:hypothetical protein